MKNINMISIIVILFFNSKICAQSLGQDANGFSTVITPTATLNIDFNNSTAAFNFYTKIKESSLPNKPTFNFCYDLKDNISKEKCIKNTLDGFIKNEDNYRLVGLDLLGSNSGGISTLFSNKRVQSSAKIKGLYGYGWFQKKINNTKETAKKLVNIKNTIKKIKDSINSIKDSISIKFPLEKTHLLDIDNNVFIKNIENRIKVLKSTDDYYDNKKENKEIEKIKDYLKEIDTIINTINKNNLDRTTKLFELLYEYKLRNRKSNFKTKNILKKTLWIEEKKHLNEKIINKRNVKYLKNISEKNLKKLISFYKKSIYFYKKLIELEKKEHKISQPLSYFKNLIYTKLGITGSGFKYDLNNNAVTINERFENKLFKSYSIELGYTLQYKEHNFFGASLASNYTNNVNTLTNTTFKLKKEDSSITDGNFTTTTEINALSGKIEQFMRYDINLDYIHLMEMKLGNTDDHLLSINPYLRHHIYQNSKSLKNNTILGIGIHAFSRKKNQILGGLFVQTNDVFGVHTNNKSTIGKRINFGIIVKIAMKGIKLN